MSEFLIEINLNHLSLESFRSLLLSNQNFLILSLLLFLVENLLFLFGVFEDYHLIRFQIERGENIELGESYNSNNNNIQFCPKFWNGFLVRIDKLSKYNFVPWFNLSHYTQPNNLLYDHSFKNANPLSNFQ